MSLEIIKYPNPFLKEIAKDVKKNEINDNLRLIISNMSKLMIKAGGIGLAATQVSIKKRFFIMCSNTYNEKKEEYKIITIINPKIIEKSNEIIIDKEGCLSFPGIYAKINRFSMIKIKALNEFGEKIEIKENGFMARCIQHEIDHLNGITFFNYFSLLKRRIIEKKLKKIISKY